MLRSARYIVGHCWPRSLSWTWLLWIVYGVYGQTFVCPKFQLVLHHQCIWGHKAGYSSCWFHTVSIAQGLNMISHAFDDFAGCIRTVLAAIMVGVQCSASWRICLVTTLWRERIRNQIQNYTRWMDQALRMLEPSFPLSQVLHSSTSLAAVFPFLENGLGGMS